MRDLTHLRLFLLAAMGFGPAAGCQQASAGIATGTTSDVNSVQDAALGEIAGLDAGQDGAGADTVADASAPDSADAQADAATVDAADVQGSDTKADISPDAGPDTADVASVCSFGAASTVCYGAAELKAVIENPPMGGDTDPKSYTGPLPPEACPDRNLVLDGCCNSAQTDGVLQGDTCCYVFCAGACCGRPLMVQGLARTAELRGHSAWAAQAEAVHRQFEPELAAAWRADGREEHAAIASFYRLGMELLAVGAPPALVGAASHAASDEVAHAQICFAWARALDGADDGPGPLPLADLTLRRDLPSLAVASALEGGIGETLAAAELALAAAMCPDPKKAQLLRAMADDEARHAALAWQVVAWALAEDPAGVRPLLTAALGQALNTPPAPFRRIGQMAGVSPQIAHLAGRLTAAEAERTARRALAEVVRPCALALLPELAPAFGGHASVLA